MKNKKLFAILTLVCFMMTLMPVAAFAAVEVGPVSADNSYVFFDDEDANVSTNSKTNGVTVKFDFNDAKGNYISEATTVYVYFTSGSNTTPSDSVEMVTDAANNKTVKGTGYAGNEKLKAANIFALNAESGDEYDFAFFNNGTYKVHAFLPVKGDGKVTGDSVSEALRNIDTDLRVMDNKTSVEITSSNTSSKYAMTYESDYKLDATLTTVGDTTNDLVKGQTDVDVNDKYFGDGAKLVMSSSNNNISANSVNGSKITLTFYDADGKKVKGENVTFETNSANIELNKTKATTDSLGQVDFKIAGVRDGEYKIYVKCGSYEATITVQVGATGAQDIKLAKSPEAPIDITDDLGDKIQFTFTDANGNAVKTAKAASAGAVAAFDSYDNAAGTNGDNKVNGSLRSDYVAIVSQPSASKLENKDFRLEPKSGNEYKAVLAVNGKELVEGTYTIKVVLDNGKYVTVTFEVKEFGTPVALNLEYEADAVELDSYVAIDTLEWVDANGVTKDAKGKVDLAASGYAVEAFLTEETETVYANGKTYKLEEGSFDIGTVFTKDDDKYVGQTITVVAVDDRYNLTAQTTLTVADEATSLAFDTKTLAVNANNKVGVSVVDSQGNKVALNRGAVKDATISYVVLDKPEDSKVSVSTDGADNNILTEGTFKMNVTANKVGNVTIQAVAKVTYEKTVAAGTDKAQQNVVKYYTGTQIFAVGKDSVGQVVVMSIGSNEIIINDAKGTIDAAPMIQNDRTYVPFRALAEAFGATVAYDEATQAVTAELNGVTVVMTIGSATYTVNGAEKTMDVAPFITGSRTMIPVRFAAEAFGIKVIPTYNPDGSTADILFNL